MGKEANALTKTLGGHNLLRLISIALLSQLLFSSLAFADGLSKGRIGPLKAGVHIFKLARFDMDASVKRKMFEEDFFLEYSFDLENIGVVEVLLNEDDVTVYRLATASKKVTTKSGAHVGLTLKALRDIYPNASLSVAWEGEEGFYSFILPEYEGVFVLDANSILDKCGESYPDCENYMKDLPSVKFFTF